MQRVAEKTLHLCRWAWPGERMPMGKKTTQAQRVHCEWPLYSLECGAKWEIKEEQSQVHAMKQPLPSNFGDQVKAFAPGDGKLLSRIQKKEIICLAACV